MVLWPLVVYALLVVLLAAAMIAIPQLIGERLRSGGARGEPYESGMLGTGGSGARFSMKFYLFALMFLIFDLEAVFLYAWAVSARQLGWLGYLEVVVFVAVLLAALVYLWRDGALDWGTTALLKQRGARLDEQPEADVEVVEPATQGAHP